MALRFEGGAMRYEIVTWCRECGADEKQDYRTIKEARKAALEYLEEYPAVAIYDYKKGLVAEYYNNFPLFVFDERHIGSPKHKVTKKCIKNSLLYPVYGYRTTKQFLL